MKNKTILFILMFCSLHVFAQNEILKFKNDLKEYGLGLKHSFTVHDSNTNNLSIILESSHNLYSYLFDEKFEKIAEIKSKTLPNKYKVLLGNGVDKLQHNIYFSNNKKTRFGVYSFDFDALKVEVKEFEINLKYEEFIQSTRFNNSFYIFTIAKGKSIIYVYSFTKDSFSKKIINLSKDTFLGKKNAIVPLYKSIYKDNKVKVEKIESHNPNSIEHVSTNSKFYTTKKGVIISLDIANTYTQIININLSTFEATVENFKKPYLFKKYNNKSNSYFLNDKLLQFSANSDEFVFNVQNIKTKQILKEFRVTEKDTIAFKNSSIIQEGGFYDNYRELEKTKKFLRKISQGQIGISVHNFGNGFQVTLGGFVEVNRGGMVMPGFGGIPMGSIGGATLFFNPTMFAYNSYANTKSTYINCLFDNDFNHIKGDVTDNVFDKVSAYKEANNLYINAETMFNYGNDLILGYFVESTNTYKLIKFSN